MSFQLPGTSREMEMARALCFVGIAGAFAAIIVLTAVALIASVAKAVWQLF